MKTLTTNGITIQVENHFLKEESQPNEGRFCHAYRITILNESSRTVQLMSRHWKIQDSNGSAREVKGDGVIGQQPTLMPGQTHQYVSWCPLETDIGEMSGTYQMRDVNTEEVFEVVVPAFRLLYPPRQN